MERYGDDPVEVLGQCSQCAKFTPAFVYHGFYWQGFCGGYEQNYSVNRDSFCLDWTGEVVDGLP